MPTQRERRDSKRISSIRVCLYELSRPQSSNIVELSEGQGFMINLSRGGMLLFLPQAVDERQVFEVMAPSVGDEMHTTKLVEVRWTRRLPVAVHTTLYLAGVRFMFEPPFTSVTPRPPVSH